MFDLWYVSVFIISTQYYDTNTFLSIIIVYSNNYLYQSVYNNIVMHNVS